MRNQFTIEKRSKSINQREEVKIMIMNTYSMTCSCGDTMTCQADSREKAVANMQSMMTEDAIKAHMDSKHPGEPMMSKSQVDAGIAQKLQLAS